MILSGKEIKKRMGKDIIIEPFSETQLNPNSYNLRLHNEIMVYNDSVLDMKEENKVTKIEIPPEGYVFEPGKLYLGRTVEYTRTLSCVPMIEGRSSIGRLGLVTHVTAGFGDVGFTGYWTLEMFCIVPIRVYAGVEIVQTYYYTIEGDYELYKSDKYQNNSGIQVSQLYKDFLKK